MSDLPGVQSIDADPGTKLLQLKLDASADSEGLVKAIENAGFHPQKI